jgi:hypothetical protein
VDIPITALRDLELAQRRVEASPELIAARRQTGPLLVVVSFWSLSCVIAFPVRFHWFHQSFQARLEPPSFQPYPCASPRPAPDPAATVAFNAVTQVSFSHTGSKYHRLP